MARTRLRETEASFQRAVCDLAALTGWRVFHPYLSIRSAPGFPDLLLTRPGDCVLYVEIKLDGKRPTPAQQAWLDALQAATGTEVYCWHPEDWPAIAARLLPTPAPGTIKSFSRIEPC
jgi:hypothetical protein